MSRRHHMGYVTSGPGRPGVILVALVLLVGLLVAAWSASCRPEATATQDRTEVVVP